MKTGVRVWRSDGTDEEKIALRHTPQEKQQRYTQLEPEGSVLIPLRSAAQRLAPSLEAPEGSPEGCVAIAHSIDPDQLISGVEHGMIMGQLKQNPSPDLPDQTRSRDEGRRRLAWAMAVCTVFMVFEVVGGTLAGSLAVVTDAAHLMADIASMGISVFALTIAKRPVTRKYSFGFQRSEILGAMASVLLLWLVTGILCYEAVRRMQNPQKVNGPLMFGLAVMGLLVQFLMLWILSRKGDGEEELIQHHGHSHAIPTSSDGEDNINVRLAICHIMGDTLQFTAVIIASILIWWQPGDVGVTDEGVSWWMLADPVCTVTFTIVVIVTTKDVMAQGFDVLMGAAPEDIDYESMEEALNDIRTRDGSAEVVGVHDVHVWPLSHGENAMACHIEIAGVDCNDEILMKLKRVTQKYNISHSTMQIEHVGAPRLPECSHVPSYLALTKAVEGDDSATVREVVKGGGENLLHQAAEHTNQDLIQALLKTKPNPNAADKLGNMPLHLVVEAGGENAEQCALVYCWRQRRTQTSKGAQR